MIGASFATGVKQGRLITVALTLELLFLGVATVLSLGTVGTARSTLYLTVCGLSLVFLAGAGLGGFFFLGLSGPLLVGILAFAVSALLYLVTEQLLAEAHEQPDTAVSTAMFFAGFLLLMLIEMGAFA